MDKTIVGSPDGGVPVFLDPVIAYLGGLNQEQAKAGCAYNMFPPYRPECHTTGEEYIHYVDYTPDMNPYIYTACEYNRQRIPHCYTILRDHPSHIGQTDHLEDPQHPSEDPSTTLLPTPSPSDDPENQTGPDVPYAKEMSSDVPWAKEMQTPTVVSSHPYFSIPTSPPSTEETSTVQTPTVVSSHPYSSVPTSPPSTTEMSSDVPSTEETSTVQTPTVVSSRPYFFIPTSPPSSIIPPSGPSPSPTSDSSLAPAPTSSAAQPIVSWPSSSAQPTSPPIVTSPTTMPKQSSNSSSTTNEASETGRASSPKPSLGEPEPGKPLPTRIDDLKIGKGPSPTPILGGPKPGKPLPTRIDDPRIGEGPLPTPILGGPKPEKPPSLRIDDPKIGKGPLPTPILGGPKPGMPPRPELPQIGVISDTGLPTEEFNRHMTVVVEALGPDDDKHKKHLALGLGIGIGAGIPSVSLFRWFGNFIHTLSTVAKGGNVYTSVMKALTTFKMDMIPHFNFGPPGRTGPSGRPGGGTPESEVAESVDEWYDDLCRNGNTGEQAAEIINNFKADMAAAEAAMADEAVEAEAAVNAAAGRVFTNPNVLNSWAVQAAAQVASTPGSSVAEIADSLLKAGVPSDAVTSTADAVAHSVNTAAKGWIGRPAYNAALGVISSSVTSAGMAGAEAAKAAVKGASGPGLAASLGAAGVPASAADATATAVKEAIQAAVASGSDPTIAAINAISNAASPSGLAAGEAWNGASGSSLAPALEAAGVPTDALGATAAAVGAAMSANRGSRSAAMNAAADIIASAASPPYERMSNPAPPVSPAQAALDAVGASFNFWHIMPWLAWDTLNKMDVNETDSSEMNSLAQLLALGAPPTEWPSRFTSFPYRRGGNRVTGVPALPIDALRPTPSSTYNGTHNDTQSSIPTSTHTSTPTLPPAPPGTGG